MWDGFLWQAKWWTTSVPGTDDSWEQIKECLPDEVPTYTVTVTSEVCEVSGGGTVDEGGSSSVSINAPSGCMIKTITVNNVNVAIANNLVFNDIIENKNVVAVCACSFDIVTISTTCDMTGAC